jgi:phosphoribosylaminoimidazole-succinocarboxamide synthase
MDSKVLGKSNFEDITLLKRGKVRDVYEIDDKLLIVASDRISAFDVVMDDPIPAYINKQATYDKQSHRLAP